MHSPRLNVQEINRAYPEISNLRDGDQINVNHVGCGAGRDTKRRLYVKRDGARTLYYCHHCQGKAAPGGARTNHIRRNQGNQVDWSIHLPRDMELDPAKCHVACNAWLGAAGITTDERYESRIGWSKREGRVILPVYDNNLLAAYQRRRVLKDDPGPKYLTTRRADMRHPVWHGHNRDYNMLVLTEDILSAICVGRAASSMALLGTHMADSAAHKVADKFKHIVVWLDDDNPTVRAQQRKIAKRLRVFCDKVSVVRDTEEPKHLHTEEVKKVLDNL